MQDRIHEKCGVFGMYTGTPNVAGKIICGLMALQHRGQESAGVAVCDTLGEKGNISFHKGMGLVSEVFKDGIVEKLPGNIGVGHVRYSTTGASDISNAQPVVFNYLKGTLATVHNGNLINTDDLRDELLSEGAVFRSDADTEVLSTLIARERAKCGSIEEAVNKAACRLKGSYAIVIMSPRKLVAMRDPLGLKPMCLGKIEDGYVVASEDCALRAVGAEFIRDVLPGEILTISKKGIKSDTTYVHGKYAHCIFEYIYFARLDSKLDGIPVYDARVKVGRALAKAFPIDADIVTGVPDSGLAAALGYSEESGVPFKLAFHKNSYLGRTFIKPTGSERRQAVSLKLNVIESVVKDKKIVLIDDSIVRGTTIANLIKHLKEAGAKEVHVRISSPPFLYPCFYGTDVPDNSELAAQKMDTKELRERIGADSLYYARLEDVIDSVSGLDVCSACFDGNYPA